MQRFFLIRALRQRAVPSRLGTWRNTSTATRRPGTTRTQRNSVSLGQLAAVFEKMSVGERTTSDIQPADKSAPAGEVATATVLQSSQRPPALTRPVPPNGVNDNSSSSPLHSPELALHLPSLRDRVQPGKELSASLRAQLVLSLQGLPNNALMQQLAEASSRRDSERGPLLLCELFHRAEGGHLVNVSMSTLFSILRLLASFHRAQLEACTGDLVRMYRRAEKNEATAEGETLVQQPGSDWVSRLWTMVGVLLAENCSEFRYSDALRVLHLLSCSDGFFIESVCETLVDTVRIHLAGLTVLESCATGPDSNAAAAKGPTVTDSMNELSQLSMLLDSIALHAVHCKALLVRQRDATPSLLMGTSALGTAPDSSNTGTTLARLLQQTRHPIANEALFMLVTHRLAALVNTRQGEHVLHDGLSPATLFFMLRALSNAPWINNACIDAIIQRLPSTGPAARGGWKGIVLLLGRREVTVTDARVVEAVLRSMVDEVQSVSRRSTPSLWMGFARLTALLVYVQHMLKVCFTKLHQEGATDALRTVQGGAKLFYTELCDNVLHSARTIDDLCKARVVVALLHHLLFSAPRSIGEQHPLIRHLAFALTQTVPTLRLLADPARERIQLSVERLQELGILNDGCEMAEENFVKFPLLREAALRALQRKAHNFWKSAGDARGESGARPQTNPDAINAPEAPTLKDLAILFVQFRKHVKSWS